MNAEKCARGTKAVETGAAAPLPDETRSSDGSSSESPRPRPLDALKMVLGNEWLSPEDILVRLSERGWAPGASSPRSYLTFMMRAHSDVFEAAWCAEADRAAHTRANTGDAS
jgi:hypothetical protein